MLEVSIIPKNEFDKVKKVKNSLEERLSLIADMCRLNTLVSVKKAGSGHLGSSFSAMDIVVWLYFQEMNLIREGEKSKDRDIYFSSKGHDAPGLYSVLYSLGVLPEEQLLSLRRLKGLDGHPNIRTPWIEANTGSLGMGISKGKGIAIGKKMGGNKGQVYVLTGDGEFQEGQIYESLQTAAFQNVDNLTVIMDHNKVQSDCYIKDIIDLGEIEVKMKSFGWHVERCDGHDYDQLCQTFKKVKNVKGIPKMIIADTIKGKGISFMEHPEDMKNKGFYNWHSGAPEDEPFITGFEQLKRKIDRKAEQLEIEPIQYQMLTLPEKVSSKVSKEFVADGFGKALVDLGRKNNKIVVIDADLAADCRVREFGNQFPDRFFENGIAEQDMVSMAGGLAKEGFIPVVNSFASFLSSRANEQIYNNSGENRKVIYACHYAGLIPAGPGLSHQSIRDISLLRALPNMLILQPCNIEETQMILKYCTETTELSSSIRLIIGPSPRKIELPETYSFEIGKGAVLKEGYDSIIFSSGPVMLHEALCASELMEKEGVHMKVVNMPWLNRVDKKWLSDTIGDITKVFTLDDHSVEGGLGDTILNDMNSSGLMQNRYCLKLGLTDYPEWGTPAETLNYHKLDGQSICKTILERLA